MAQAPTHDSVLSKTSNELEWWDLEYFSHRRIYWVIAGKRARLTGSNTSQDELFNLHENRGSWRLSLYEERTFCQEEEKVESVTSFIDEGYKKG